MTEKIRRASNRRTVTISRLGGRHDVGGLDSEIHHGKGEVGSLFGEPATAQKIETMGSESQSTYWSSAGIPS